jgi:hypothetical protein
LVKHGEATEATHPQKPQKLQNSQKPQNQAGKQKKIPRKIALLQKIKNPSFETGT